MKLERTITGTNMNQRLVDIQYAVRGPLLQRAIHIEGELRKGVAKPFERVVRANIGDCHALGQPPITFIRQVLSAVSWPELVSSSSLPDDVKQRARDLLDDCTRRSVGAYSPSPGLWRVRCSVTHRLRQRDGPHVSASPHDVLLGSGASDLIKVVLSLVAEHVDGKPPAVLVPTPQYPLFSSALSELGVRQAQYYLDEEHDWALCVHELRRAWARAQRTAHVRALVVINPGNPTGQVLTRENMEEVIKFAYDHNLFLLADEVYQENIVSKPFHSFKKVMHELGAPYSSMELASFATCSKGWAAECGLRAAYVELLRLAPDVRHALDAARAYMQCPSVLGQCALDCVVRPPVPGEPSYAQYAAERAAIQRVLTERTRTAHDTFNSIPGYACNTIDGAMFAYPRIDIPDKAQEAAREGGMSPDEFYCLRLLEETGVCVVPGTGFGQLPGTFHFRTTILHPRDEFQHMMDSIRRFHMQFLERYT